jgi:MFS family permease
MSAAGSLWLWLILAAAFGASNAAYRIGANAMVADLVEPERRVDAYALIRTSANVGVAIGPAVGGFIAVVSYALAFYLAAGAHLVFLVLTVFLIGETLQAQPADQIRGPASYAPVLRDRPFMAFVGMLILGSMPAPMTFMLLPVYLKESFGIPENMYGFLVTNNAIMVVTMQYAITRLSRRYRPLPVMALGALLYGVGTGSIALGRTFPAFLVSMIVLTFGEMLIFPTATALTANLAPPDMRARYMGVFSLSWGIGSGIGPMIGGLLSDNIAPVAIWYGTLAMGLAGALGFLWLEWSPRSRAAWKQAGLQHPD